MLPKSATRHNGVLEDEVANFATFWRGKAAAVDYSILENGCDPESEALRLAKKAKRKHGHGTRKVPKLNK